MKWKTLKSETVLKNKFLTIKKEECQRKDGHIIPQHYTIEKEDSATIVALTEDQKLIMTKQYRHPAKIESLEPPAGYLDKQDKNAKQAAERELLEETGYKPEKTIKLNAAFPSIGVSNTKTHFFLGLNCKKIASQNLDPNEYIEVKLITFKKALNLIKNEKIHSMPAILAILLAHDYLCKKST